MLYFLLSLGLIFLLRVLDNMLGTAKTIFIQRNRWILAGIAITVSTFIAYYVTKIVVIVDGWWPMIVASIASGVGCSLAIVIDRKFSKDRIFVSVVMCKDKKAMCDFRDFLAKNEITNVATDSYTKNWDQKSITITVYADTMEKHKKVVEYIEHSELKMKCINQEI